MGLPLAMGAVSHTAAPRSPRDSKNRPAVAGQVFVPLCLFVPKRNSVEQPSRPNTSSCPSGA